MEGWAVVAERDEHANRARLLRRVLGAFRLEDDTSTDRAIRRRVEGAVIAEELAAGKPAPIPLESAGGEPTG